MDLSILIPARNERFLRPTVEDVLRNSTSTVEVLVVADGAPLLEDLPADPRVHLISLPASIGQRAATNLAADKAQGRFIMKLDAHCALAPGYDTALIAAAAKLDPRTVQIPSQKNLHVYNRKCRKCGHKTYQGPLGDPCESCKGPTEMQMVWKPRRGTTTSGWTFDRDLKFQYKRGAAQPYDEAVPGVTDVMTSLGACFFIERAWYLELGGFDESIGSWGQYGQELACKAWLSGGRHVCNENTWFAHFFRVGGIGFPYPITAAQQDKARDRSRALWRGNDWPQQTRPLRWLVDKFWPIPNWSEEDRQALDASLEPVAVVSE